jgi:hypothetical protein
MKTKTCRLCNEEKPLTLEFFHKDIHIKDNMQRFTKI